MKQNKGILEALKFAHRLAPNNQGILNAATKVCISNLKGVSYDDKFDRDDNGFIRRKVNRLPREHLRFFKREMNEVVAKRRLTDPSYRAPKVPFTVTTWTAGAFVAVAVLASIGWAIYCAMPDRGKSSHVVNPGVVAFAREYVVEGLDPAYGINTCKIMYVDPAPNGKFEVTGQVQPSGQTPVMFQLTVQYHPQSPTPSGRYAADSSPRFEIPMRFSQ